MIDNNCGVEAIEKYVEKAGDFYEGVNDFIVDIEKYINKYLLKNGGLEVSLCDIKGITNKMLKDAKLNKLNY